MRRPGWLLGFLLCLPIPVMAAWAPPEAVAAGLMRLAFGADALDQTPPRDVLSRWAEPVRLFVFADAVGLGEVRRAAAEISGAAHFPIAVLDRVARGELLPNAFVVISPDLAGDFRGQLRPMLSNAFLDDPAAVARFTELVVAVDSCWVLPVWTDAAHLVLKAAVIGVDARLPPAERQRCLLRKLGGALGLLGDNDGLADSVFAADSRADRLSAEDRTMLGVLYGPALRIGMDRTAALAAAETALGVRPPYVPWPRRDRGVPPIEWELPLPAPPPGVPP
jgi:hypothetical protein